MKLKIEIMDEKALGRALTRVANEIIEKNEDGVSVAVEE